MAARFCVLRHLLTLRFAVAALNVLFVAAVGAVSVVFTLTVAMRVIHENGESALRQASTAAALRTNELITYPLADVRRIATLPLLREAWPVPGEHPFFRLPEAVRNASGVGLGGPLAQEVATTLLSANAADPRWFRYFYFTATFLDGTAVTSAALTRMLGLAALSVRAGPFGGRHQQLTMHTTGDGGAANTSMAAAIVAHSVGQLPADDLRDPARLAHYREFARTTARDPRMAMPEVVVEGGRPHIFVTALAPIANATHAEIGFVMALVTLDGIGALLDDAARVTPNAAAFIVDVGGFLLGADTRRSFFNVTNTTTADEPPGCANTEETSSVFPSTDEKHAPLTTHRLACRHHATDAPDPGVAAAARARPDFIAETLALADASGTVRGSAIEMRPEVGGTRFTVLSVPLAAMQRERRREEYRAVLVLSVPEADIVGAAATLHHLSLLVTAGAVVAAALATALFTFFALRPLRGVATRMRRAAQLEDDEAPVGGHSWFGEVAALQDAFDQMTAELVRIRAFVPQSLLKAQSPDTGERSDEELEDIDPATDATALMASASHSLKCGALQMSERAAGSMQGPGRLGLLSVVAPAASMVSSGSRARGLSPLCGARPGLEVAMTKRRIGILVVNLRDFHPAVVDTPGITAKVAEAVRTVITAADAYRGVVDSFHGDRFMLSFNAVRPAAAQAANAALVGRRLADELPRTGVRLRVSAGAASGLAQVGNIGPDALRRFNVVGWVVPQASALERLCKMFQCPCSGVGDAPACLIPQPMFDDVSCAVATRILDLVRLPGVRRPLLVADVLRALPRAENDEKAEEWMYQLQNMNAPNPLGVNPMTAAAGEAVGGHGPEMAGGGGTVFRAWILLSQRQFAESAALVGVDPQRPDGEAGMLTLSRRGSSAAVQLERAAKSKGVAYATPRKESPRSEATPRLQAALRAALAVRGADKALEAAVRDLGDFYRLAMGACAPGHETSQGK